MVTAVSINNFLLNTQIQTIDPSVVDFKIVESIENKFLNLIEEDKKLVNPVFLFIKKGTISKLAYFLSGYIKRPIAVGIAGASASGKSTFSYDMIDSISNFQDSHNLNSIITRVNTDDYYFDRSEMVKKAGSFAEFAKNYDLDVPAAFELALLKNHIEQLVLGNNVMLPKYDMSGTAKRYDNHILASPNPVIVTEGLFTLTDSVKDVFDLCIYVDVSSEVQKERWFNRAAQRSLVGDAALNVYTNVMEKAEIHIKPSAQNADIIINGEADREDYKATISNLLDIVKDVVLK